MFQWRVIAIASLAVLLLLGGLAALILPGRLEGDVLYAVDEAHAITALDSTGLLLLVLGSFAAVSAGLVWQRRMDATDTE